MGRARLCQRGDREADVVTFGVRVLRVLAAAALTVLALFGLTHAYGWQAYDRPLERALAGRPEVVQYTLHAQQGPVTVEILLADVPNLREAYLRVEEAVAQQLGARSFRLVVRDRRDGELVADYYALHYYVAEALTRGTFADAAAALERAARERGVERVGFYVDERYAYLQLHRGPRYLYAVMRRQAGEGERP
jgi:hypothetical protein